MEKFGYCGLNCEKCDAFIATISNDQSLKEKTAELWSKLNNVKITPDQISCEGCKNNGIKTEYCSNLCEIRKCAIEKNKANCGRCIDLYKCSKLNAIISNNTEALNYLNNEVNNGKNITE